MYTLTMETVCAVLAQSPWGKPERCVRFDILRSLATVEECYRAGMEDEERLRRLATETGYLVTRSKTHCHKQRPRIDFSTRARGKK